MSSTDRRTDRWTDGQTDKVNPVYPPPPPPTSLGGGITRRHFADDIFKCIFLNENIWFPIKISLKFVPQGLINNIPALVQIMAWRRPGHKLLSEPMMVSLPTHICVTQPQWVKYLSDDMHSVSNIRVYHKTFVTTYYEYLTCLKIFSNTCLYVSHIISMV